MLFQRSLLMKGQEPSLKKGADTTKLLVYKDKNELLIDDLFVYNSLKKKQETSSQLFIPRKSSQEAKRMRSKCISEIVNPRFLHQKKSVHSPNIKKRWLKMADGGSFLLSI
ncbi:hypothetical protein JTE90_013033 [Oedothorax gibbosus]|uniref:Uncharacterized protein n=1 Tax=Oedothorax gibbosus TaxID=931172 RepID=A0AAV6UGC4_9ARAC|nr:hypothetical protein JTE90_013033 [Oedothorax gibbosus]